VPDKALRVQDVGLGCRNELRRIAARDRRSGRRHRWPRLRPHGRDCLRQFAERADQAVGVERLRRHLAVAEIDLTGTLAARAVRTSVVESPIMVACCTSPPARRILSRNICGSGFCMPNVSWPQIAAK
jgi:hypothetical protein